MVAADGPYVYVAVDGTGEDEATSLDAGTPYSGCQDGTTGVITPEYTISTTRLVTEEDCLEGHLFIPHKPPSALAASTTQSRAGYGDATTGMACVTKYHKYTGFLIWTHDMPDVSGLPPWSRAYWQMVLQPRW